MIHQSSPRLLAVLICLLPAAAFAADQPQWGQRYSRNMVSEEKGLPDSFDPASGKNVKWTVQLGSETYATPIVAGGRVFIGTNNDHPRDPRFQGDRAIMLCLDEKDGSLCWQLTVPKLPRDPYLDWPRGGIVSPPTIEGDRVYVLTNRDEVLCLDIHGQVGGNRGPFADEGKFMAREGEPPVELTARDADIIWRTDLKEAVGMYPHDAGHASILLHGPLLYLNTCNGVDNTHRHIRAPNAPSLVALDKATGRVVAQDDEHIGPLIFHSTWSSPALGVVHGKELIFFGGGDGVCYAFEALRPEALQTAPPAGPPLMLKKVWSFDCDPAGPKETGVDHRYTGNRQESPSNIKGMPVFYQDRVYIAAGGDIWWGKHQAWLKCIDATKTGDLTKTGEIWSHPVERHCCATSAIADGLLFISDCGKTVHCLDPDTGQPYWTHLMRGEMWASPLVADGKVYIGTRRGDFAILVASKEKKVLCTVDLGSPIAATATAANGVVYIATDNRLYAVRKAE